MRLGLLWVGATELENGVFLGERVGHVWSGEELLKGLSLGFGFDGVVGVDAKLLALIGGDGCSLVNSAGDKTGVLQMSGTLADGFRPVGHLVDFLLGEPARAVDAGMVN